MRTLFVGGDYDGEWIDISSGVEYMILPRKIKTGRIDFMTGESEISFSLQTIEYKLEQLYEKDMRFFVMAHRNGKRALIEELINGYRKPKQE